MSFDSPGQRPTIRPPLACGPSTNITLPRPWSVPPAEFDRKRRPNSLITTRLTSCCNLPRSRQKATTELASQPAFSRNCPACETCVSQPSKSTVATRRPMSCLMVCATVISEGLSGFSG